MSDTFDTDGQDEGNSNEYQPKIRQITDAEEIKMNKKFDEGDYNPICAFCGKPYGDHLSSHVDKLTGRLNGFASCPSNIPNEFILASRFSIQEAP